MKKEKNILLISFAAGVFFVAVELVFSIYSHSQSVLIDMVYDAAELVFIAFLFFLTPLYHQPISEKHPYGYFQIEAVFLIIKVFVMLAVTASILVDVVGSVLAGGNPVNGVQIALFQLTMGIGSGACYAVMRRKCRRFAPTPTIDAELLGWRVDMLYSLGMAASFGIAALLHATPLSALARYADQIMTIIIIVLTAPECIRMLWRTMREVFLFSPDEEMVCKIKNICCENMSEQNFNPLFFDIAKTGRHLWIAVYFEIPDRTLVRSDLKSVADAVNAALAVEFADCTCELILVP